MESTTLTTAPKDFDGLVQVLASIDFSESTVIDPAQRAPSRKEFLQKVCRDSFATFPKNCRVDLSAYSSLLVGWDGDEIATYPLVMVFNGKQGTLKVAVQMTIKAISIPPYLSPKMGVQIFLESVAPVAGVHFFADNEPFCLSVHRWKKFLQDAITRLCV